MKLTKIESYHVRLPLMTPFQTSYGTLTTKAFDLIIVTDELGNQGYGELLPFEQPDYLEETLATARIILRDHLVPLLVDRLIEHPRDVSAFFAPVRGNEMAKACIETAIWDLYAKAQGKSISDYFKNTRSQIPVGISLGIETDLNKLIATVEQAVKNGYQRVKLKIKPGYDIEPVKRLRQLFPELTLMVDANSAYGLADIPQLKKLDSYQLAMIEQPFAVNDFLDHRQLQKQLETPICLDENIRNLKDCQLAHHLGSCRSINLKISRVGGLTEAMAIIDYCQQHELMVWLGGMFESGVGRGLNLHFASQASLAFPGDLSASERYFHEDIITTPFRLKDGLMTVPTGLGIGITLDWHQLNKLASYHLLFREN
ncbi:o-succinylbenzoate synthase [uncultured Vagococcus sp.]|uniref:o-succinylbenzoate synthase n=1 Tax=uncultured Vagococcus sp. TaxID=189676 RepID=UPI0028D09566|nr:o-succinylbenzoate synthase [uncultured Vagococcus sp.]